MCMDNEKRWWYSLTRHTVEDDDGPTPGKDRLGPFPTPEAAARAGTKNGMRRTDKLKV
jgi:hypothetical protein